MEHVSLEGISYISNGAADGIIFKGMLPSNRILKWAYAEFWLFVKYPISLIHYVEFNNSFSVFIL